MNCRAVLEVGPVVVTEAADGVDVMLEAEGVVGLEVGCGWVGGFMRRTGVSHASSKVL